MEAELQSRISGVYRRVAEAWDEHRNYLFGGACGYSIFGSEPVLQPTLMVLGENPGFGQFDRGGQPHIQNGPPTGSYFDGESWPLKQLLRDLFKQAGLENAAQSAVFANFLFFKSGSLANEDDDLSWHKVDKRVRAELESLCRDELRKVITLVDPQAIIILGMGAFDRHASDHHGCVKASDGVRRLICKGTLWDKPAVALMHSTGARWSEADRATAVQKLREHFSVL